MVSKCPTHPTTAGNRWGILAQATMLEKLGAEVHFLYVEERAMKKGLAAEFDEMLTKTSEYWGDKFHLFSVPVWQKAVFNIKKRWYSYNNQRIKCDSYFPMGLVKFANELNDKLHFDACIVNYYFLSKLLCNINIPQKAIFTHDNFAYKDIKIGCRPGLCLDTTDANEMARAMQRSQHIFAVQDEDSIFFKQLSPQSHVYTIYCKYDYHPQAVTGNKKILFLSGNNGYNQNGILWFINDIFPLIRKRFADAELLLGGGICKIAKKINGIPGIRLLGFVDNLKDFYALGDVAINPVYQGTGLKIKTFEAISFDKVTLVHPHSLSGIFHKDKAPLFVLSKPKEWVDCLEAVWKNPDLIVETKKRNEMYLAEMNEFILSEYKRFLNS